MLKKIQTRASTAQAGQKNKALEILGHTRSMRVSNNKHTRREGGRQEGREGEGGISGQPVVADSMRYVTSS